MRFIDCFAIRPTNVGIQMRSPFSLLIIVDIGLPRVILNIYSSKYSNILKYLCLN